MVFCPSQLAVDRNGGGLVFFFIKKRAEDGTRIRDPNLGKVVLYQLSYFRLCFLCRSLSIDGRKDISDYQTCKCCVVFFWGRGGRRVCCVD